MIATLGEDNCISELGANMYLKILLAIDSEVVDRTIDHVVEVSNPHKFLVYSHLKLSVFTVFLFAENYRVFNFGF